MRFGYLLFIMFITGCSVFKTVRPQFNIDSQPKAANVEVLLPNGDFNSLGTTPLMIEAEQINEWKKNASDFLVLRVSKSGFASENLIIDLNNHHALSYSARLNSIDVWNHKEMDVSSNAANKLAVKIQSINQQIFNKNFETALRDTEVLIDQFPRAHVFYDMKGSILYLMGKRLEAAASYQKSLSINPDNSEAKKMLQTVKGEVNL